jgi:hypothetical protein
MDLSDFYPAPEDLIKSEIAVLGHLRASTYIKERHPQVAQAAQQWYYQNKASRSGFQFNTHFDIWHQPMHRKGEPVGGFGVFRPNTRLTISALVELSGKRLRNVSYCLSVCKLKSVLPPTRANVLRKFHFDVTVVDEAAPHRRQPHPRCHLQYCGEMLPYMTDVGCTQAQLDQMHPWLSQPRIFFWPMSLALLIDMALHEFPDQHSEKFRAEDYWRGLVRGQEALILRPFYEKCVEIIKDTGEKNQTLADAFYVT